MLLIVDDNQQIRAMIRSLVDDLDSEIFECVDGSEAVTACQKRQPNWILMDIKMKPMDGLTATRQIKRFFPEIKIVIVTDYADNQTRKAAFDAGAIGFCGKENLMSLREIIAGRRISSPQ